MFAKRIDIPNTFLQETTSKHFFLRQLTVSDAPSYAGLYQRNRLTPYFGVPKRFETWGIIRQYAWARQEIKTQAEAACTGRGVLYGLFQNRHYRPKLIGLFGLYLHYINYQEPRSALPLTTYDWELLTLTDRHPSMLQDLDERRRLGLTLAARAALLKEAAKQGIQRVISRIETSNLASLAFAQKSGFRHPIKTVIQLEDHEYPIALHVARVPLLNKRIERYIQARREEKCRT